MTRIILLLSMVTVFTACKTKNQAVEIEKFKVISPIVMDTTTYQDYVAEIQAIKNIEIRAKAHGFMERVYIDEGSYVQEGTLLFSINNGEYKEKLQKASALRKIAETEQQTAELELQNVRSLLNKNVVSKIELEFAKNKLATAKARVEEARAEESNAKLLLSYTEIKAPFSGYVNRLPIKLGSLIEEGTLLTTLSQNDKVFTYFDISEKVYYSFAKNNNSLDNRSVSLVLPDESIYEKNGVIGAMEAEIDQQTGNLALRATFDNTDGMLKHGSSGKIRLFTKLEKALLIPQKSTFEIQDRVYVFVVDKATQKVMTRQIEIRTRLLDLYVINHGLTTDDVIVFEGVKLLQDGMKVQPEKIKMSNILKNINNKDNQG